LPAEKVEQQLNSPAKEAKDPAEAMEAIEANDPIEPIEQELPMEPIENELPIEPTQQYDPIEPIERALPMEPSERREPEFAAAATSSLSPVRSGDATRAVSDVETARRFIKVTRPRKSSSTNAITTCRVEIGERLFMTTSL
jgi:hypothetical protein